MNLTLGLISIILVFSSIIVIEKLFKKEGLYVYLCLATVLANIIVVKTVNVLGLVTSLGNILFAANFLITDILIEKYSKEDAKKAVNLGLISTIIFIIVTQISILYIPDTTDIAHDAMKQLFDLNLRTSIASLIMYYISNNLDIHIFTKLKEKNENKLWLRNNVSTIISNCLENYFFATLAFIGIFDFKTILSIATTGTIIEIIIALLDTPFLYLAKHKR